MLPFETTTSLYCSRHIRCYVYLEKYMYSALNQTGGKAPIQGRSSRFSRNSK